MKAAAKPTLVRAQPLPAAAQPTIARDVPSVLAWLAAHSSPQILAGMARYGMPAENALGVAVGDIQLAGKLLGHDHALAAALWKTGGYEARMVAAYVDEPGRVTAAQMDRWALDFDSWGICDTVCFVLFDRTPHAWAQVEAWADRPEEFVQRAAFALLWGLTRHDKTAPDARFLHGLKLIEQAARDERHFVKKAVNMALRATGKRNAALRTAAAAVARRLAASPAAAPRWVGKDALRELQPPARKAPGKGTVK